MRAYYNDIDPFCCKVLRHQISLGNLPPGDVDERDIRDVKATDLEGYGHIHLFAGIGGFPLGFMRAGVPDDWRIITGGFPCQDISNAGRMAGIDEGERSGLWSDYARIVRTLRPRFVVVENVAAILERGIDRVLGDLAESGYDAEWDCLPACEFGADHKRDRAFIVAYPKGGGWAGAQNSFCGVSPSHDEKARSFAAEPVGGCLGADGRNRRNGEPGVAAYVHGIPARLVDGPNRAIGNAVVPQVAEFIGRRIIAAIG